LDLAKISDGTKLSPILLVRGSAVGGYACRSPTAITGCAPAI
jgi:hypothetical protein